MSKDLMSMYYLADYIRLNTGADKVDVDWKMTVKDGDKQFKIVLTIGSKTQKEFESFDDFKKYVREQEYIDDMYGLTADEVIRDGGFHVHNES